MEEQGASSSVTARPQGRRRGISCTFRDRLDLCEVVQIVAAMVSTTTATVISPRSDESAFSPNRRPHSVIRRTFQSRTAAKTDSAVWVSHPSYWFARDPGRRAGSRGGPAQSLSKTECEHDFAVCKVTNDLARAPFSGAGACSTCEPSRSIRELHPPGGLVNHLSAGASPRNFAYGLIAICLCLPAIQSYSAAGARPAGTGRTSGASTRASSSRSRRIAGRGSEDDFVNWCRRGRFRYAGFLRINQRQIFQDGINVALFGLAQLVAVWSGNGWTLPCWRGSRRGTRSSPRHIRNPGVDGGAGCRGRGTFRRSLLFTREFAYLKGAGVCRGFPIEMAGALQGLVGRMR